MGENLKIGIASFAHGHAFSYAGNLRHVPDAELAGITDEDRDRGRELAARYCVPFFENPEELMGSGIKGVMVCSDNAHHLAYTEMAAKAGVHVMTEKPIATTLADAKRMIGVCRENGVKLQMAYPCRFHPTAPRVKEIIQSGRLGDILAVKGTNHGKCPFDWFVNKELSGGGAVIDHTVHVVDLMRWMMGVDVVSVYAESGTMMYKGQLDVDDIGLITMELSNGAFATLDTSWSRCKSFPTWGDVTMEVVGSNGQVGLDMFAQNITAYSDATNGCNWVNWGDDMDGGLVRSFLHTVRTGEEPSPNGEDGLAALEVALAAYESSKSHEVVRLK